MPFTAEALGLALPGNGTIVATHSDRKELFLSAGELSISPSVITGRRCFRPATQPRRFRRLRERDDTGHGHGRLHQHRSPPAGRGTRGGGSVHARRHRPPFAPHLCKVAPSIADIHIEDVHRAGGICGILGELDRLGLLHRNCGTVHAATVGEAIDTLDVRRTNDASVHALYRAAPGGRPTLQPFSQSARYGTLNLDRSDLSRINAVIPPRDG